MKKVLVTSGNSRIAYNICRSLSKRGFTVFVGEGHSCSMASVSRYCSKSMRYSSPFTKQRQFLKDINTFLEANAVDILIPVLEETYTIAKYRNDLSPQVASFLPDYTQILAVHDKSRLTNLARGLGISVPPTWEATDLLTGEYAAADLPFPVILKPKQGGGGWGMQKFTSGEELMNVLRNGVPIPERFFVQGIVEGRSVCVCGICNKGKLLASDSYVSTTVYPLQVGQATTRESWSDVNASWAFERLLGHLGWSGVCEMDFIVDNDSGTSYLLDVNPRFWGGLAQNLAAGVEYPYYYCQLALGQENFPVSEAVLGRRTRWLGGDIMRMVAEFRAAESKFAYLSQAMRQKVSYALCDDWDRSDPLPFLAWGLGLCTQKILKRKKDTLPDIWE